MLRSRAIGRLAQVVCVAAVASVPAAQAGGTLDVRAVAFIDATHGVLSAAPTGNVCRDGACPYVAQWTSDGGRSWTTSLRAPVEYGDNANVASTPSGVVWALFPCSGACRPSLYRSSDGGKRWQLVARPRVVGARFATAKTGWALTGSPWVVMGTADGGRTWRPLPKQPCAKTIKAVVLPVPVSDRRGFVMCSDNATADPSVVVYETRNGGRSWHVRGQHGGWLRPIGSGFEDVFTPLGMWFDAAGRGWLWRYAGRPLRSSDGGRSWRPVAGWPFSTQTQGVLSFADVSASLAYALMGTQDGPNFLATTADGGRTWRVIRRWPL